jgi:hypothetical protein
MCDLCRQVHVAGVSSEDGFPVNVAVAKRVDAKTASNYPRLGELKTKLADLSIKCDGLKHGLRNNETDKLKQHCAELRAQVCVETEATIRQVRLLNDDLIAEIDRYEIASVKMHDNNLTGYQDKFNVIKNEVKKLQTDCSKRLGEFMRNEKLVEDALVKATSLMASVEIESQCLRQVGSSGKWLGFRKRQNDIDSNLLGVLIYEENRGPELAVQNANQFMQINVVLERHFFENMNNADLYDPKSQSTL